MCLQVPAFPQTCETSSRFLRLAIVWTERERQSVHAVSQSGRRGAVWKHMAEVAPAACAVHFGSGHKQGLVDRRLDGLIQWLPEAPSKTDPAFFFVTGGLLKTFNTSIAANKTLPNSLDFLIQV